MSRVSSLSPSNSGNPGNALVAMLLPVAVGDGDVTATDWLAVERALAALPLMTADYGLCRLEIGHAREYLANGEPGAAGFEIRLMLGRLARLGLIKVMLPKSKSNDRD